MNIENYKSNKVGFFGQIENAVIKNLSVSGNINAPDKSNVGMIVGLMSYAYIAGGGSRIENCVSEGTIEAKSSVGGIAGYSMPYEIDYQNYITNCVSNVKLEIAPNNTSENNAGGIVGQSAFTIIANCVASGSIHGNGDKIGGIAGYAYDGTQIINCITRVDVEGASCVGGISGSNCHEKSAPIIIIANCVAEGNIIGTGKTSCNVGGISGIQQDDDNKNIIKNCFFTGTLNGNTDNIGAIVGNNLGIVLNCGWLKNGGGYDAIGGNNVPQGNETTGFDSITNQVCAYTVDPASLSFNREAGIANPLFRTWPGNDPSAVLNWSSSDVPGVTLTQDGDNNTVISATKKGVFNVGASLILTATKFGKSDVVPLRLAGDTADTSSNPLLAPALSAAVRVTSDITRVKSIKITNAPQSLKEGEAFNLSCEVLPEDATNKDLVWSSSNNKVAAVTGQSGEITALLAGETVITVEARDGSGIRDQFTLTVKKDYLSNPKPERPVVKTDTAALSEPEYYGESEIEELAKAISMDKSLLTAKEDGSVILRQDVVGVALESVKKENPGLYYESVMPVPLIKAACGSAESGRIIAFGFTVSGDNFGKADSARDIKVMKVLPDGRGVLFKAIGEEREIEDRSCALYKGGEIYSGPVMPEENYVLTLFIKDGGEFDLDGAENGSVIDPLVVLKAKEAPARESSSGGGCSAGFGGAALLAFAALPVLLRGRRRR